MTSPITTPAAAQAGNGAKPLTCTALRELLRQYPCPAVRWMRGSGKSYRTSDYASLTAAHADYDGTGNLYGWDGQNWNSDFLPRL